MSGIVYLVFFLAGGVAITRFLLPQRQPIVRWYLGAALGVLLYMWLPALWAYAVGFSLLGHGLAAVTLVLLVTFAYFMRDPAKPLALSEQDQTNIRLLLYIALPLTLLTGYLAYTHSIRPAADGSYHVGQSTYGDLSLHLAITTSAVNASFPLQNNLLVGTTLAYPYLSDTAATSLYMLGVSLPMAMTLTGTLFSALAFSGYVLLASALCKKRGAATLAVLLLFLNGGLGFFYTLSGTVENGVTTTVWDNLRETMTGFYKTPTNQPDPYNLRWVNIICDMLIPQRSFAAGWAMLTPVFLLLVPPLSQKRRMPLRELALAGIMAGGLPLVHTHSFLALGLASIGFSGYALLEARKGDKVQAFRPFLLFGGIAVLLALPQLIPLAFAQATGSDHFLRFQFNWCNNRGGNGLVEPYLWFYLKNIGIPYLLIILALFQRKHRSEAVRQPTQDGNSAVVFSGVKRNQTKQHNAAVRQYRFIAAGAFFILLIAEFILFQPNEYDNNKLIYVWFLLCLPMAADYLMTLYEKLRGLGGRRILAVLVLIACFLSAGLTIARELVGDYQAYTREDVEAAAFIHNNTPEHSVFITGTQHLNPAASLAGRSIVCGTDLYLYFHGYSTADRKRAISLFYENPADNLALLEDYDISYVYISNWERSSNAVDEAALDALFPRMYESESGNTVIWDAGAVTP